jgi:hypothetical protein
MKGKSEPQRGSIGCVFQAGDYREPDATAFRF